LTLTLNWLKMSNQHTDCPLLNYLVLLVLA
jgi:hypothetical protein